MGPIWANPMAWDLKKGRFVSRIRDEGAIGYLVRLFCFFARPKDVLAAYLRRPLVGYSFRQAVEQLTQGKFGRRRGRRPIPDSEIVARAERMLQWLDGKEGPERNPYEVLGLSCPATGKQILSRYRALSKRVHPDRHSPARQPYWHARQEEVNEAYRILADPQLHAQWLDALEQRKRLLCRLWKAERAAEPVE